MFSSHVCVWHSHAGFRTLFEDRSALVFLLDVMRTLFTKLIELFRVNSDSSVHCLHLQFSCCCYLRC